MKKPITTITPNGLFGNWLSQKIAELEITPNGFSKFVELNSNTIVKNIRCECYPTLDSLIKYSKFFDVDMQKLIDMVMSDKTNEVREEYLYRKELDE